MQLKGRQTSEPGPLFVAGAQPTLGLDIMQWVDFPAYDSDPEGGSEV